ncbi:hypothetical protein D3C78_1526510 [compost metagenome]
MVGGHAVDLHELLAHGDGDQAVLGDLAEHGGDVPADRAGGPELGAAQAERELGEHVGVVGVVEDAALGLPGGPVGLLLGGGLLLHGRGGAADGLQVDVPVGLDGGGGGVALNRHRLFLLGSVTLDPTLSRCLTYEAVKKGRFL